jgi:hypothetical protein
MMEHLSLGELKLLKKLVDEERGDESHLLETRLLMQGASQKLQIAIDRHELAQKILEMIAETEKSLHNKPDQFFLTSLDADTLQSLKNAIKELYRKEMKQ